MKLFDLKKFRSQTGLNQQEFADKIERSQGTVSRIEAGDKKISDKLLDRISKAFQISLEEYKSYSQQEGDEDEQQVHQHKTVVVPELEFRYYKLLEEKAKLDDRFFALSEKQTTLESALVQENNLLLKKIVANTEEILLRFQAAEK